MGFFHRACYYVKKYRGSVPAFIRAKLKRGVDPSLHYGCLSRMYRARVENVWTRRPEGVGRQPR